MFVANLLMAVVVSLDRNMLCSPDVTPTDSPGQLLLRPTPSYFAIRSQLFSMMLKTLKHPDATIQVSVDLLCDRSCLTLKMAGKPTWDRPQLLSEIQLFCFVADLLFQ